MRVHDSQAYRKMAVTRERISRILELREILLSFQTGFNLVNHDAVAIKTLSWQNTMENIAIVRLNTDSGAW